MLSQDNIMAEKEFFSTLIKKVQESEKIHISNAPIAPRRKKLVRLIFRFDTLDIKMSFHEDDVKETNPVYGVRSRSEIIKDVTDISEIVDMTIMDKTGKKLLFLNCELHDAQGATSELRANRFTMAKKLYNIIINKAREQTLKKEALKKATQKAIIGKKLKNEFEQQNEAIVQALDVIKML